MNKVYLLVLIVICFSCRSNKSDDIIIEIGKLQISRIEYRMNEAKRLKINKNSSEVDNLRWKSNYLDQCYFIADALSKQYDTISSIKERLETVSKFMMVQKYGPLWQTIISPIVDEFKEPTKDKIKLRENIYYFDIIRINDKNKLLEIVNKDTIIEDIKEFNRLKSKCSYIEGFSSYYSSIQWPFFTFWELKDYLTRMNEGQLSKLLNINNYCFYFYLDKIEKIKITEQDLSNLKTELQLGIEKEIDDQMGFKIISKCKLELNHFNLKAILDKIQLGINIMDQQDDLELLSYKLGREKKVVSLDNFQKYYMYYPLRINILDSSNFYNCITQYFFDDYLWHVADSMNLPKIDTFIAQRKNYYNQLLYTEYINKELYESIKIDTNQIKEYYHKHLNDFFQPQKIIAHTFSCHNPKDFNLIKGILIKEFSKDKSLKNLDQSFLSKFSTVNYNSSINIDSIYQSNPDLAEQFLNAHLSEIIEVPLTSMNEHIFVCKIRNEGQKISSIETVSSSIESLLKKEKLKTIKDARLKELKIKFKLTINEIE